MGNLAQIVHPHLDDEHLAIGIGGKHGIRRAEFVVEVSFRCARFEVRREDLTCQAFRGGFAHRPRDRDDCGGNHATPHRSERGDRFGNVVHYDDASARLAGDFARTLVRDASRKGEHRPSFYGASYEIIAINPLSG